MKTANAILERRRDFSEGRLARYRIEVGREHMASPKDIVGAIANEAGIESRYIGQINLYEDYTIVELPSRPARRRDPDPAPHPGASTACRSGSPPPTKPAASACGVPRAPAATASASPPLRQALARQGRPARV